jgi:hypothetical protein
VVTALAAFFIVAIAALAVDFGLLVNQHRQLQAYVDEAAAAGSAKLDPTTTDGQDPSIQQSARQAAFIYLRNNLLRNVANPASSLPLSALGSGANASNCGTVSGSILAKDMQGCPLPSPLATYTVSICTPGDRDQDDSQCAAANQDRSANTVSVYVRENVATSFANVFGVAHATAAAYGEAQYLTPAGTNQLNVALFSYGCITTGNQLEIVGGDVYVDKCSIQPQSSGNGAFCAQSNLLQAGNIVFGPEANVPTPAPLVNQSLATCRAATAGQVVGMGQVVQRTQPLAVPAFPPPPGWSGFSPTGASPAVANNRCYNGTVDASGNPPNNCYNPGVYSSIGACGGGGGSCSNSAGPGSIDSRGAIANNLNPGVYYVTGENDATCPANQTLGCHASGVVFGGNTMNANWNYVADRCWAAPNTPAAGSFTAPCVDGVINDPTSTAISDPQCSTSGQAALPAPTYALTSAATGGFLDPAGTGSKYFVRVTALDAMGETTSTEQGITVASPAHTGKINIAITAPLAAQGVTSYNIYVSPASHPTTDSVGNDEISYANVTGVATSVLDVGGGSTYPRFDTSSCKTGFHNIPNSPDRHQNNGVTFVLMGQASLCLDASCTGSSGSQPTVMLSPFCSSLRSDELPSPTPSVTQVVPAGTACPYANTGPYINDGAFQIYGAQSVGWVEAAGTNTRWSMSGTLYGPSMYLNITSNAQLSVVCGQGIFRLVNIQSGNHLTPSFYNACSNTTLARPQPLIQIIN